MATAEELTEIGELRRRLDRLRKAMARRKLDAMLVFDRHNTFYLTGMRPSFSYLLITRREAQLYVDGRYVEAAREGVRHCEVMLMRNWGKSLAKWFRGFSPRRIGFEGTTAWSDLQAWQGETRGAEWVESGEAIAELRLIKSAQEAKLMAESAAINDRVYEAALAAATPGATELDVRNAIRWAADRLGAEGLSFDCIVAAGEMGSRPHYTPNDRPLRAGELLLIDLGVRYRGYCSDMTRTVALGREPSAKLRRMFDVVLDAQQTALDAVKPGVPCAEIDRIARETIVKGKLGRYFTHGLGHGVGLEIHEAPRLNPISKVTLKAGMAITIEPGVYLPGVGGVRIEDLVLVTRRGHQVLSGAPKRFTLLPFD